MATFDQRRHTRRAERGVVERRPIRESPRGCRVDLTVGTDRACVGSQVTLAEGRGPGEVFVRDGVQLERELVPTNSA